MQPRQLLLFFIILTTVVMTAKLGFGSPATVMQIWDADQEKLLRSYEVQTGDQIGIKFIHSYDKGPVWEYFSIQEDGSFLMHEVAFAVQSYDARELTFPEAKRVLKDGIVYLKDIDDVYEQKQSEFLIRVPYTVPQWILFLDQSVELSSLAPSGTLLRIKISKDGG